MEKDAKLGAGNNAVAGNSGVPARMALAATVMAMALGGRARNACRLRLAYRLRPASLPSVIPGAYRVCIPDGHDCRHLQAGLVR